MLSTLISLHLKSMLWRSNFKMKSFHGFIHFYIISIESKLFLALMIIITLSDGGQSYFIYFGITFSVLLTLTAAVLHCIASLSK